MRALLVGPVAAATLVAAPSANGKEFEPGSLRVCNASRCVPIMNRAILPSLGRFYYSGPPLTQVRRPALWSPYYELRTPNGYVTGIVATRRLDRFLSYGVHDQRFERDQWYAVPGRLSAELRRLTKSLRPRALDRAALARSR